MFLKIAQCGRDGGGSFTLKIAQPFRAGCVGSGRRESPVRDGRRVLSSLTGLSELVGLNPALKGWAIFGGLPRRVAS